MMIETGEGDLSIFNKSFWDLWLMKNFRNFASAKYQWLFMLYIPTIWGMFHIRPGTNDPWISASIGLGFLGGGFVTLALGRLMTNTKLKETGEGKDVNIHKQTIQRGQSPTIIAGDQKINSWNDPDNILDTDK